MAASEPHPVLHAAPRRCRVRHSAQRVVLRLRTSACRPQSLEAAQDRSLTLSAHPMISAVETLSGAVCGWP